jgi:hypothetical protein
VIEERTLVDGGQTAEAIADRIVGWLGASRHSLDIALSDVRLPGPIGDAVAGAIRAAAARGVAVRMAFNSDGDRAVKPLPPPPRNGALAAGGARRPGAGDPRPARPHASRGVPPTRATP